MATTPAIDPSSSSTITTTPPDQKVAAATLDFLLIELVPLAQRMAAELCNSRDTASTQLTPEDKEKRMSGKSLETGGSGGEAAKSVETGSLTAAGGIKGVMDQDEEDEEVEDKRREDVLWRLDALGFRVGQGIVEKFSANTPRPSTPLDMIKFICKDLWLLVFRKQIDNLKTNHRGTYVLTDTRFMALSRMSADTRRAAGTTKGIEEALTAAQPFLYFPCGIIRGALSGFGLFVTVHAETTELPLATFQIRTVESGAAGSKA